MLLLLYVFLFAEECEIHASVCNVSHEIGMLLKAVVFAMLEDEYSVFAEQVAFQDEVGYASEFLERVWRVGKDQVVTAVAPFEEAEHVISYYTPAAVAECMLAFLQETEMQRVHLHRKHILASS